MPIIAICDTGSTRNWISSAFVKRLESKNSSDVEFVKRVKDKGVRRTWVKVRWSSEVLENYEESTFVVEPKAHFKMSFGCAKKTNFAFSRLHTAIRSVKSKSTINGCFEPQQSMNVKDALRLGISQGRLLPVKSVSPGAKTTTMAQLEDILEEWSKSCLSFDQALEECSPQGNNSASEHEYMTDYMEDVKYDSPASSVNSSEAPWPPHSSGLYHKSCGSLTVGLFTQDLNYVNTLHNDGQSRPEYCSDRLVLNELGSWSKEESHSAGLDTLSYHASQHIRQEYLREIHNKQESVASSYWEWDNKAGNYKHYDEDIAEVVWYNPPEISDIVVDVRLGDTASECSSVV